ncbi:lymphocyte antigen 96 isoform X2 [Sceloporus undulatus]|uniref:lymphocyte antigen 96 isoform X2 n=1 Tax=Sceloporus undulatus TaxID=8520 RepID=UPI001C4B6035|nr:lymphocyte antigen 96 isoform X2 [Sceloporus undulatus]
MFQLAVMILSVYGFTMAEEKYLLCRSDDLDIFFSSCGPGRIIFFFRVEPCSLKVSVWRGRMFWIPKADITTLAARIGLWHEGTKVLKWKTILCHGVDDDYSFCGTLKGETINTTVRISGAQPTYLQIPPASRWRAKEQIGSDIYCSCFTLPSSTEQE